MTRFINGILLLATIIGIAMLMQQRSVLAELHAEYDRLSDRYGVLDVKDPGKFYVLQIDSGDPMDFIWRVYRPRVNGMEYRVKDVGGSSYGSNHSSSLMDAEESIYRHRFIFQDDRLEHHRLAGIGNGRSGIGDPLLSRFLKEHWNRLEFEVLEEGVYDVDQPLRFLTMRVPESLHEQLKEQLGGNTGYYDRITEGPVIEIVVGTPAVFEKLDAEEGQ